MRLGGVLSWLMMASLAHGAAMAKTKTWYRSKQPPKPTELAAKVLDGDIRSATVLMSLIEDKNVVGLEQLAKLFPHTGMAHVVGFTGPQGGGKSTLVGAIAREMRSRGLRIAILTVDPSSPISGGALLGDRIRMGDLSRDDGVVIRSLASRQTAGGLSRDTMLHTAVFDGLGADVILVETVGAGQDEVAIAGMADTTVVVMVPKLGDEIQGIKAGLLEVGDIFVVNKGDLQGAADQRDILRDHASTRRDPAGEPYEIPVLITSSKHKKGISELLDEIEKRRVQLFSGQELIRQRRETARNQLLHIVQDRIIKQYQHTLKSMGALDDLVEKIAMRELDPYSAAGKVLELLDLTGHGSIAKSNEN